MKKLGLLLLGLLFLLVLGYFVFMTVADVEMKNIALEITKNAGTDKEKALAIANWIHAPTFNFGNSFFHIPEVVFFTRVGDCIDFSNIFVRMSNSVGLPARVVATDGEAHSWVEIYSEGKWVNLDPFTGTEQTYNNPRYYVEEWPDGNYHKRLSFVYWEDGYGDKHELTEKYVDTGHLVVKLTENEVPLKARVIIKSHHLIQALPNNYSNPYVSLVEATNDSGIFEKDLGPNTYTIIVERDVLPIFSILVLKTEKEVSLEEKEFKEVKIDSGFYLGFGEFALIQSLFLIEIAVLIYVIIQLVFVVKGKMQGGLKWK